MTHFLSGAVMMSCVAAALFFGRYWVMTRDRLFWIFSLAFWILAVERWILEIAAPSNEFLPYVYLFRLLAFLLFLAAIIDKNRR